MGVETLSQFTLGDIVAWYQIDRETERVGLCLYPAARAGQLARRRETLRDLPEISGLPFPGPFPAWQVDSLVQIKCVGDAYPGGFSQGRTMRNSISTLNLRLGGQQLLTTRDETTVVTTLSSRDPGGYVCEHRLSWRAGEPGLRSVTSLHNTSSHPVTLEMLSSFSLGGITPFAEADAPGRLVVHRLRSTWSAEGRLESRPLEELHLERSWLGHSAQSERFGQVGSMPVRSFFPFVAVEDTASRVTWAAALSWAGSWQLELYRKDDCLCLSGGLADREFGQWVKTIGPGESFVAPPALLTVAEGDVDEACALLTALQTGAAEAAPAVEADLPIVCNEWCTSWGRPTHDNLVALADRLRGSAVRYLVIDAGWYAGEAGDWETSHGDWVPSRRAFPGGLAATAAAIRERGLVPGLWFEMETCGPGSTAFSQVDRLLRRDGIPVQSGLRRFWDLRDPGVQDYLAERVIGLLRDAGFGYLKVDYNETIGVGCDGAESPGEGLRQQIEAVYAFFGRIHHELPELVIENCSSGGHRLEASMVGLTAMSSFSDAHELPEIPVIAANLHRAILPRQSQIWAVLRRGDSIRRLVYSLAATFLGRMCLSGELIGLAEDQWAIVDAAQRLYRETWTAIRAGRSYRYGPTVSSYRHPEGWQAVVRLGADGRRALVVVHAFAGALPTQVELPLPAGEWRVTGELAEPYGAAVVTGGRLVCPVAGEFSGRVTYLTNEK